MIEFKNVTKLYGKIQAIRDLSLKIKEGEKFVLLGTSGSGKSTILKHINALIKPTSGTIKIQDQNIESLNVNQLRRNTGYVIQEGGLFPHYNVKENIELIPSLLKQKDKSQISSRTLELLQALKLNQEVLGKYPNELSGGQRQRVGIARALANNPDLLLFDEPLSALDPITKSHILNDFISLPEYKTKTIIWVTHDLNEAVKVGTRICVLDQGIIQQIGSPVDILLNPANHFIKTFFSSDKLQYLTQTLTIENIISDLDPIAFNDQQESKIQHHQLEDSVQSILDAYKKDSTIKVIGPDEVPLYFKSMDIVSKVLELSNNN